MEYQEKGYIICASISEERKKYLLKEKKLHKLNCKHAYVIQKARIYNENNFLLMQNPWGETHWDGDYSENSNLWNDELIKALKGDFSPAGSFWMQYNDFKEIFDEFEVTKPIEPEWHIKMFQYQLLPEDYDGINYKAEEARLEEHKTFVIKFKEENQPESFPIYIIVEKRNTTFSAENSENDIILIYSYINGGKINHDTIINNNYDSFIEHFEVKTFKIDAKKDTDISLLFHRLTKNDYIENLYVSVVCKFQFDIIDFDDPDFICKEVDNPGIVFENYTLSNPSISKKVKIKIFNKKFVISLDSETTSSNYSSAEMRDKQIENLFKYRNMDFSLSHIDLTKYCIKEEIGSGTNGHINLIEMKNSNRQKFFAAKVLKKTINEIPIQFLRELKILYSLRYPSIVKFIGFSEKDFNEENYPVIVMEYLQNGSLYQILNDNNKHLNNTKKMIILIGVALGIKYLHIHGIIHRDLKLQNILLDDELYPKICDFGDSKPINLEFNLSSDVGTPLYMAPEVSNNTEYSYPADVYSYGMIAYYIYSGLTPSKSPFPNCSKIKNPQISNFVKDLINEDPDKRPTFEQIVTLFLNGKEKTWLDNVDEKEIEKYLLHKFGLKIKQQKNDIDLEFINSIDEKKYPMNAKQPKITIEEIINNESILPTIRENIKLAEIYSNNEITEKERIKEIRKHLREIGFLFCMGDNDSTRSIHEDYYYGIKYLKAAALLKDKTSLYMLATLFAKDSNEESHKIAFRLADASADLGYVNAFSIIGIFYKNGIGVQINNIMSAIYFKIAADKGDDSAMYQFARMMMQISIDEIVFHQYNQQMETANNIIKELKGKSNKVYREIQYTLEAIQDKNVALFVSVKYFEKSAKKGNKDAEEELKQIQEKLNGNNNEPEFVNEICQSLSISIDCED